jgi:hypothetical protein
MGIALPECSKEWVTEASEAVKREYRNSLKWKQLRCRSVTPLEGQADGSIFALAPDETREFRALAHRVLDGAGRIVSAVRRRPR